MHEILALTRYGRNGASSRLRTHQYTTMMHKNGFNITVEPLFPDEYIEALQKGNRAPQLALKSYLNRASVCFDFDKYDIIWIEKELFPWLPYTLERALLRTQTPYVIDIDDAVYHRYDKNRWAPVRILLGKKISNLMKDSSLVIAGNEYLSAHAISAGARRVEVVPTAIESEKYSLARPKCHNDNYKVVVGWIGQASTGPYLLPYQDLFKRLSTEIKCEFVAIGLHESRFNLNMTLVPWSENTEAAQISKFDVGIMPLPDRDFEKGKCGYKIIQYMACGIPVIASPVGVNQKIVIHGQNGLLAKSAQEWEYAIRTLVARPALRSSMGAKGRDLVQSKYCIDVTGKLIIKHLNSILK